VTQSTTRLVTQLEVAAHWCHECDAERTVEIVQLVSDPRPVALCAECGVGLDLWLDTERVVVAAQLGAA
jgi:hypothetical protein